MGQPASVQHSEADDGQLIQVCELETENIYLSFGGSTGSGSCSIKSLVLANQRSVPKQSYLKWK